MVTVEPLAGTRVKGVILISRKNLVRSRFGVAAWSRVVDNLPAVTRHAVKQAIKGTAWYPIELNSDIDRSICDTLAGGDASIFGVLGAHTADLIVKTTFPAAVRQLDPILFLKAVPRTAPRFYEGLRVEAEVLAPDHVTLSLRGMLSYESNCLSNLGYYARAIEICGGVDPKAHELSCTTKGDNADVYDLAWTAAGSS